MTVDELPIETASLRLRQIVLDDAREFYLQSNEPLFRAWLPSQVYSDEAKARSAVEFLTSQYASPGNPREGAYVLAIEHKADGALIGHVGLSPFDDDVEVGFAIAERYQGRGLAVEAVVATCRWAFGAFGLERILGIAASENIASRRTLARAGFVHQRDEVMRFQGTEQPISFYVLSVDVLSARAGGAPSGG